MTKKVRAAFAMEPVTVRIDQILPTRPFQEVVKQTTKYKTIAASVREVGIIEPMIVHPQKGGKYLLLRTDLLMTVPRAVLAEVAPRFGLVALPCPVKITPIHLSMFWSAQLDRDPAIMWFRQILGEAAGDAFGRLEPEDARRPSRSRAARAR